MSPDSRLIEGSPLSGRTTWSTRHAAPIVLGVVGAVLVLVIFQLALRPSARRLGLLPTQEQFTELSFAHPARLPTRAAPHTRLHLDFVILNREQHGLTYHWSAVVHSGSTTRKLAAGSAKVAASQRAKVPLVVSLPRAVGKTARIEVSLSSPPEALVLHLRT